jgi:positive regulator of sigma E activity
MAETTAPIEEPGLVVSADRDRAEVQVTPHGGCEHCGARGICNWTGKREKVVLALNPIGAQVGQPVMLGRTVKGGALSALMVFGLPGGLLLAGVVFGSILLSDKWAAGLAGAGLVLGVVLVRILDRAAAKSGRGLPRIMRLLSDSECKGEIDAKTADADAGRSDGRS